MSEGACLGCGGPQPCPNSNHEFVQFLLDSAMKLCDTCHSSTTHMHKCPHYKSGAMDLSEDHPGWSQYTDKQEWAIARLTERILRMAPLLGEREARRIVLEAWGEGSTHGRQLIDNLNTRLAKEAAAIKKPRLVPCPADPTHEAVLLTESLISRNPLHGKYWCPKDNCPQTEAFDA